MMVPEELRDYRDVQLARMRLAIDSMRRAYAAKCAELREAEIRVRRQDWYILALALLLGILEGVRLWH